MSTLTSTSTLTQVNAAYDDNASYAEDDSPAKARAFVTACTILIRRLNDQISRGDSSVQKRVSDLREEKKAALEWIADNDDTRSGPHVTEIEFTELRQ